MGDAIDYELSDADATTLAAASCLPFEFRRGILAEYSYERLVEVFAQFIGLSNSVVENNRDAIELIGLIEGTLLPGREHHINLPTILGALMGVPLANSIDQAKVCSTCAFRKAAPANQCVPTVTDANWCQQPGNPNFMCHEHMDGQEPTRLCIGYAQKLGLKRQAEREA